MSGYLCRRIKRSSKRNWFVLKDSVLYIYKAPEDVAALEAIPVLGYRVQVPENVRQISFFKVSFLLINLFFSYLGGR